MPSIFSLFLLFLLSLLSFFLFGTMLSAARRRPPRRRPPGPAGWPLLGNLPQLGAKPHQTLHALSQTHGPLIRLRFGVVEVVVASSAAAAAQFLRAHDANFSSRPPNSGAEHVAYNYRDLVFAPYGERWRALRRLCAVHLFSAKAVGDFSGVREGEVRRLVRRVRARAGAAVDLGGELNRCAADALGLAAVERRVFGGSEEGAEDFRDMVSELMKIAGVINFGDFLPGIGWLDLQGVVKKMKKLHRRFDAFLSVIVAEHKKAGEKGGEDNRKARDILTVLIRLKDEEGLRLTDIEIKALLLNLFTAGTDTTSSTVEWAISELIRQPNLLSEAQSELDSIVGLNRLVSESDLPRLPLLQAIVKETFRLHPSTPLSLPRIAEDDCEIDGYFVPRGATLLVNIWSIARDPSSWPHEPLAFRPGRFLKGGPNEGVDLRGTDFELIPFGAGRRICAGLNLGLRTVQILVATMVHAFSWELEDGRTGDQLDMEEAYGITLHKAKPLVVKPMPRLAPEAYA